MTESNPPLPTNNNPERLPGGSYWLCEYGGKESVVCIAMTGKSFAAPGDLTQHKLSSATFRHQLWPLADPARMIPIRIKRNGVWVSVDVFACTKSEIAEYFGDKGQTELKEWLWLLLGYSAGSRALAAAAAARL